MDRDQYAALDVRLQRLENEAVSLRAHLSATPLKAQAPAAVVLSPAPEPAMAAAVTAPEAFPPVALAPRVSLEGFFAGRGLQVAGLFLVLLGAAFFLNLAFTNGWIGPAERILLGLVAGVALVAEGTRRHRPGNEPIAEGLLGLGAGILYLSLWAAVAIFPDLHVSRAASFFAMLAVTVVLAAVATARRSERVALFGLVGGFLTPVLLNSGVPQPMTLAIYVFLLALGFAALGIRARYHFVEAAAFVGTLLYMPALAPSMNTWSLTEACVAVTALCALFAIVFAIGAKRDPETLQVRIAALTIDAVVYAAMLAMIFVHRETALGIAFLIMAATLLLAARFVRVPAPMTVAYGYLGLAAATLALPALLHRMTLLDAIVVEGAVLVALGARRPDRNIAVAGVAMLALSCLWLLGAALYETPANTAFSSLALAFAITIAALVFARTQIGRFALAPDAVQVWSNTANVVTNVIAIVGISRVLVDALGGPRYFGAAVPSHAQFALSAAWTLYATALFAAGMWRSRAILRYQGLILFGATIFKVFTVDLGSVDMTWRIASFVVLGVVCLGVSAWYMRSQASAEEASP